MANSTTEAEGSCYTKFQLPLNSGSDLKVASDGQVVSEAVALVVMVMVAS